jgi:hypothetical protein
MREIEKIQNSERRERIMILSMMFNCKGMIKRKLLHPIWLAKQQQN